MNKSLAQDLKIAQKWLSEHPDFEKQPQIDIPYNHNKCQQELLKQGINFFGKPCDELQQFIDFRKESGIEIPQPIVDRFCYNYQNRDKDVLSTDLYEWYSLTHKSEYKTFCRHQVKKLPKHYFKVLVGEECPAKNVEEAKDNRGGHNKKIYSITQDGVKHIMMSSDSITRDYYCQLETLLFEFNDFLKQHHQKFPVPSKIQINNNSL